jgi:hypothetical protein
MSEISLKQKILFFILTFAVSNLFFLIACSFYFNVISRTTLIMFSMFFWTLAPQVFWLLPIAHYLGFEVFHPAVDWVSFFPNLLGWLLVVIGGLVTFTVYYFVSVRIARWWNRRNLKSE